MSEGFMMVTEAEARAWAVYTLRTRVDEFAEQIQPVFALLDFKWARCAGVPSVDDIRSSLHESIDYIASGATNSILGDRLRIWVGLNGDSDIDCGMSMEIDEQVFGDYMDVNLHRESLASTQEPS